MASRQERRRYSMGCPNPRSVASESMAMSSARRRCWGELAVSGMAAPQVDKSEMHGPYGFQGTATDRRVPERQIARRQRRRHPTKYEAGPDAQLKVVLPS